MQQVLRLTSDGRIFSVKFIKRDGSERFMVCRRGVRRYLTGGSPRKSHRHLLTVYDLEKQDYRSVNLNTLLELNAGGKRFVRVGHRLVERNSSGVRDL